MGKKKVGILYMPVLHKGYLDFIQDLAKEGVEQMYLVADDVLESHEELDYIHRKDRLRALPHSTMFTLLSKTIELPVVSATKDVLYELSDVDVCMPREDINEFVAQEYLGDCTVVYKNVFLRWNKSNAEEEKDAHSETELSEFQKTVVSKVLEEATKSSDWWRQVSAALVKDGALIALAHNEHMPEKELPNIFGDTRALYKKGVHIERVTSAHAEVGVIGEAARKGVVTEGAELYVTDFPCPYCARLIVKAGISKVYYLKGYGVLDGENFLKEKGIETVKVSIPA